VIDRALALLELAEELHGRGLERLRLMPYMAPSGLYWRLQLSAPGCDDTATWSTADSPPTIADVIANHPRLMEAGVGSDPEYAAWVSRVADLARQGWLAYFFADWPTDNGDDGVPLLGPREGMPVLEEPPGGR
jgi:hypothetical protein